MSGTDRVDTEEGHRHFSAACFNRTWDLLDKSTRSPEEDEEMIQACLASVWHWSQREDCLPRNLSIGYWQVSRVHAVLGLGEAAMRYGRLCLEHSQEETPFYPAYAYEAIARAAATLGDTGTRESSLARAHELASQVEDAEERAALEKDLASVP